MLPMDSTLPIQKDYLQDMTKEYLMCPLQDAEKQKNEDIFELDI